MWQVANSKIDLIIIGCIMDKDFEEELIEIREWKTPATDYPEKEFGTARIVHGFYNGGYYHNYGVNGYKYFFVKKKIPVASLEIEDEKGMWQGWMVDDPPHWWSMQNYAKNSSGRVLVGGLGLGLVAGELLKNVDINSVTIVDLNKDVIGLISPLLPEAIDVQLDIVNKDFYDFINDEGNDFDRIIVDLWTSGSVEETMRIKKDEVIPFAAYLKKLFPDASVVFHGFGIAW